MENIASKKSEGVPMKKFFRFLPLLAAGLLVTGCASQSGLFVNPEEVVEANVNSEFCLAAPLSAVDETWEVNYDESFIAFQGQAIDSDVEEARQLLGATRVSCYQFKALQVGSTEIVFNRVVQPAGTLLEERVFRINIVP